MSPLPAGPFSCILADPPWRFQTRSAKGRNRCPDDTSARPTRAAQRSCFPERHYPTMTQAEIKALPVASVAARDCVLLLWAIDPMLPQAFEVAAAWGFAFRTVGFYWAKQRAAGWPSTAVDQTPQNKLFPMATGYWTRANPEQCLLFTRGKPRRLSASVPRLIIAPRREHSRKPDDVYPRVEALCAGPRLEMFARAQRPGWTAWGNQIDAFGGAS